jgi:hypothetical protein
LGVQTFRYGNWQKQCNFQKPTAGFLFLYGKPTIPWPVVSLNMSAFALSEVGVVVLPWSPLAGGFLTGKYRCDEDKPEG